MRRRSPSYLWPASAIALGVVLGALFVRRQGRLTHPLVDLRLFRNTAFSVALASYTVATLVAFGIYLFVGQYLQLVAGLSPLAAGLATLPVFIGFIAGAQSTPALTRRLEPATVMIAGLLLSAVGFGLFAIVGVATPLAVVIVGAALYSSGLAPLFTLATDLIVGAAPPERAGVASALSESGSELGGALGIALLGSVGTAVYQRAMVLVVPAGVAADLADAARNTLGGAIAAADRLPGATGRALSAGARDAFSRSFNVTSWICVAIVLVTALGISLARARTGDRARIVERKHSDLVDHA